MGVGYGWMDQSKASAKRKDDAARQRDAAKQKKIAKGQSTFNKYIGVKPAAASAPASASKPKSKNSYPGVTAETSAATSKAQNKANNYKRHKNAANKLRARIKENNGPLDLAGRTQRASDLKRLRAIDAVAERDRKAAQGLGLRMGSGKPSSTSQAVKSVAKATGGGGSTSASGGGATSPGKGSKSTGPRMGAAIRNARSARENTTGISISGKELKKFMSQYENSHKGTKLSRENAVLLARLVKKRGGKAAAYYGLGGSSPNPYDSGAPGTGIH